MVIDCKWKGWMDERVFDGGAGEKENKQRYPTERTKKQALPNSNREGRKEGWHTNTPEAYGV